MDKQENKLKKARINNIGILGGTFDPPHKGHIAISKVARKKFNLLKVFWAITKKNPFKKKTLYSLKERIFFSKKINQNNKFIKIGCYENKIRSNRTIDLIKYFNNKYKKANIYFIMGADNLISLHKWKNWKNIPNICQILVFDRKGFKSKSLKSTSFRQLNKKGLKFINFKKINISSSKIRKI